MIKEYHSKPGADLSTIPRTSLYSLFNRRGSMGKKEGVEGMRQSVGDGSMAQGSPKSKQMHHSVTEIPAVATEDQSMVDAKSMTAPVNNLRNLQRRFAKQHRDSVSTTYIMNNHGEIGIKRKFDSMRRTDASSQQPNSTVKHGDMRSRFFQQAEKTSTMMENMKNFHHEKTISQLALNQSKRMHKKQLENVSRSGEDSLIPKISARPGSKEIVGTAEPSLDDMQVTTTHLELNVVEESKRKWKSRGAARSGYIVKNKYGLNLKHNLIQGDLTAGSSSQRRQTLHQRYNLPPANWN